MTNGDGLDEELDFHIARLVDDLRAEGMEEEEAHLEAARRFGDIAAVRRACRRAESTGQGRGGMGMLVDWITRDARFALRQVARRPLTAGLAVVTLAVGVAATTVVHTVVDAVVLHPVPFDDPEGLTAVVQVTPQGRAFSVSAPNFVDFAERQRSFSGMAARRWANHTLTGSGSAETVQGMRASHALFAVAGVDVVLGRTFRPEEDTPGGSTDVLVLSDGAWERRYGRDPGVLGATVVLDGRVRTVIGVVASDHAWPAAELFTPLVADRDGERDNQLFEVMARLGDGVTVEEARSDIVAIAADLAAMYPDSNDGWGAEVMRLEERMVGPGTERLGRFLLAAVGLLLLMACVSVSNLQVVRLTGRLREITLRAALGAGRIRLAVQLVVESLMIAVVGGAAGVAAAYLTLPLVQRVGPADLERLSQASVNGTVLAVAVAAAVFAALVSGVAPAWFLLRREEIQRPGRSARGVSDEGRAVRGALVAAQFALALLVVAAAGLVSRSLIELQRVDLGFEPDGVLAFSVRLPDGAFGREERTDFIRRLLAELEGQADVLDAGASQAVPFASFRPSNFLAASAREPERQQDFLPVSWRAIEGDYFAAAGIRVLSGRPLRPSDYDPGGPPFGVVLDRTAASMLFPDGSDPIGQSVTWFMPGGMKLPVVGVVEAARDEFVDGLPRPRVYVPFAFAPWEEPGILVRTRGNAAALTPVVRSVVAGLDEDVPVIDPAPLERNFSRTVAWPRFTALALLSFGVLCLLLAALGIYGVAAFGVERRRGEIGVRMALGAQPGEVVRLVLRESLRLALVGVGVGLALALPLGRMLEGLLYSVSPSDPVVLLGGALLLLGVALVSVWIPAVRAVRTDPTETLSA